MIISPEITGMIKSQFSYCPLTLMFSLRKANNSINRIHERSIRVVSRDNESNFNKRLPPIMDNFFIFRENTNNLRNFQIISNENKRKSVKYGSETIWYRTPLLWAGVL